MLRFLSIIVLSIFSINASAQVLYTTRIKTTKIDTIISVTQQDIDDYVLSRKISDTLGKRESYIRIVKNTKLFLVSSKIAFDSALDFAEQNERLQVIIKTPITPADITEYLSIRKIVSDTIGKTADYAKIIKSAKFRVAQSKHPQGLYKEIDYETALKEAEEDLRLRTMVDKVLVVKSERKMHLQKKGKTIRTYNIGLGHSPIGQKEREGDGKTPEGVYKLDYQKWKTPTFHSFHISYPNEEDIARAKSKGLAVGSNIMIHGTSKGFKKKKDWTNGCIALNNTDMAEFKTLVFLHTEIEIKK